MESRYKTALFGLGIAVVLFWLVKPSGKASSSAAAGGGKVMDTKKSDAVVALKAYKQALQSGESSESLDKLNREIGKEYGMKVIRKAADNSLAVVDLEGNQVIGTRAAA
jgi:hypothetical protein